MITLTFSNIAAIIYGIIGIIVVFREHNKYFKKEYDELKKKGLAQDSAYTIYLMIVWLLWPLNLVIRYYQDKKKKKEGTSAE